MGVEVSEFSVETLPWRTSALVTAPARLPVAW